MKRTPMRGNQSLLESTATERSHPMILKRRILKRQLSLALLLVTAALTLPLAAKTPPPDHWVGTWAAAPSNVPNVNHLFAQDTTVREIVRVSLGGPLLRVILTNEFGNEPLVIGAAHIADAAGGSSISLISANALTFGGRPSVTIPPGALVVSDPAALTLKPLSSVAVSVFVPAQTVTRLSSHGFAGATAYMAQGNVVGRVSFDHAQPIDSWPIVKGIETRVSGLDSAVVCFGDSITDGVRSTADANARWPDILAERLHHSRKDARIGVLNEGISGNRVLADGAGPAALARFDRDVLAQSGVKYLIILEAINDIGVGYGTASPAAHPATADDLIVAYRQMIERAHSHGIQVFGATLTPYAGAGYASPAGEQVRKSVNDWIRDGKAFDGVVDFDQATRNPANPDAFSATADSGDHLHPKDGGYKLMGDAIDLKLFRPAKK